MAREYEGFVRQYKNLFTNAANQQLMIAPWEICPPDAAGEKNVTAKKDVVWRRVKAKASGTMAGNKKNPKGNAAKIGGGSLLNQKIRQYRFWLEKEPHVFIKLGIGDERKTIFVKSDLAFARSLDFGCVIEMVGWPCVSTSRSSLTPRSRIQSEAPVGASIKIFPPDVRIKKALVSKIPPVKV